MGLLFPLVFNALYRFYVPLWRHFPSVVIGTKLRERRAMRFWVPVAFAALPIYLGLMYAAGHLYRQTDWIAAGIVSCIWGVAYFKLLMGIPILLIRHGILTLRERHAARRSALAAQTA